MSAFRFLIQSIKRLPATFRSYRQYRQSLKRNNTIIMPKRLLRHVRITATGTGNKIVIPPDLKVSGQIIICADGNNNTIEISQGCALLDNGFMAINICGHGSKVQLAERVHARKLHIQAGIYHPNFGPVQDVEITIGRDTSFENTVITTYNSRASICIGERCMFSYGIHLYHTDGHPVLDCESGKVLNKVKTMSIGNHVWVGANATILKNVHIADDCIVGWGAVVGKSCTKPNCAIGGNPAKIVKQGVTWDACGAKVGYIANEF